MYEELINCLRMCAKDDEGQEDCPMLASHGCWKMLDEAADAIAELSAAIAGYEATTDVEFVKEDGHERIRFVPKWIPVTERLPKYGERVLVFGGVTMYVAYYDRNRYGGESWHKLNSKSHYCNPTHWMPLPTPPKEETE